MRSVSYRAVFLSMCTVAFLVLAGGPLVRADTDSVTVFSDYFDDEPFDLSDWTLDYEPWDYDEIELSSEQAYSSPYSLKLHNEGGDAGRLTANSSLVPLNYDADYTLTLRFYMVTGCGRGEVIANDGRIFVMQEAGLLHIGNSVYLGAFEWDTWNWLYVDVMPALGTYDVKVNQVLVADDVPFRGEPFGYLQVGTDDYYLSAKYNYGTWYIDNIIYFGQRAWMEVPEDFDDGDISDWTVLAEGVSQVEASSVDSHSPPYSLYVKYGGAIGRAVSPPVEEMVGAHTISFWFNPVNSKKLVVIDTGLAEIVMKTGVLYVVDSMGKLAKTNHMLTAGWHHIVIALHLPVMDLWVDGQDLGTYSAKWDEASQTIAVGSSWDPGRRDAGQAYWDDFEVQTGVTDSDGDGLTDATEIALGTNPNGFKKWAVIVTGYIEFDIVPTIPMTADLYAFANGASDAITCLEAADFDDIYYITSMDFSDSDADSTWDNVYNAIGSGNGWLRTNCDADDFVFLYFVDHGDESGFKIYQYNDTQNPENSFVVYITPGELSAWVDSVTCGRLAFVMDSCYSGVFFEPLSDNDRIVITSTDESHQARWYPNLLQSYCVFSQAFYEELDDPSSLEAAFISARTVVYDGNPGSDIPQFPLMYDFDEYTDWYL